MKPKFFQKNNQTGFTLIELLVVISIMAIITGLLVIDFNSQRVARNLVIAKNETATNLRKVQGYMLSSRNISDNLPAKFYIVTFTKDSGSYVIQAVDNDYAFHDNLETVNLPVNITVNSLTAGGTPYACLQVIYSAPFGTMYTSGSSSMSGCDQSIKDVLQDPVQIAGLSQSAAYIAFQGTSGPDTGHYIQLSPLSGQITVH